MAADPYEPARGTTVDRYPHREHERLTADTDLVRAAAGLLRNPAATARMAGLSNPDVADRIADLLDYLADHLGTGDPEIRDVTVKAARTIIGVPMGRPTVRRTRQR